MSYYGGSLKRLNASRWGWMALLIQRSAIYNKKVQQHCNHLLLGASCYAVQCLTQDWNRCAWTLCSQIQATVCPELADWLLKIYSLASGSIAIRFKNCKPAVHLPYI